MERDQGGPSFGRFHTARNLDHTKRPHRGVSARVSGVGAGSERRAGTP